jgi:hypothetical protein
MTEIPALYEEVNALAGGECQCGHAFLGCSTRPGDCCSEEAIGDMVGYCGGDTMRKLHRTLTAVAEAAHFSKGENE